MNINTKNPDSYEYPSVTAVELGCSVAILEGSGGEDPDSNSPYYEDDYGDGGFTPKKYY